MLANPLWVIIAGALSSLSYAPLFWTPFFFLSYSFLAWNLYHHNTRPFFLGWLYGVGFFFASLFWIGNSLFVDAKKFAWLWPIGAITFPSFLAAYPAMASWCIGLLTKKYKVSSMTFGLVFGLLFSLAEYAQGHFFTGFPWTVCAAIWVKSLSMAQMASQIGVYGLGLITWIILGMGIGIGLSKKILRKKILHSMVLIVCPLMMIWTWGKIRLHTHKTHYHDKTLIRLVQPSMPIKKCTDPFLYHQYAQKHFNCLLELSHTKTTQKPTCTLWPEGSLLWTLDQKDMHWIEKFNIPSLVIQSNYQNNGMLYNAVLLCQNGHFSKQMYIKNHLVPFGEYVPGRSILRSIITENYLKKITPGDTDFSPGHSQTTLHVHGCPPFICAICYEIIFPQSIRRKDNPSAQWVFNPTNDGWFGHSPGPYQHLSLVQLRAIECGLPIVRAACSGISAVIDPLGRLIQTIPLGKRAIQDVKLPKALAHTPFSRYGHTFYIIFLIVFSIITFLFVINNIKK